MIERKTVRHLAATAALLLLVVHNPAQAAGSAFFGGQQTESDDLSAFTKWTAILPRYEEQKASVDEECTDESCTNVKWEKLISDLDGKPVDEQMKAVNAFFNAVPYITDEANWGIVDFWQTPYETMARGGDCEDYAIAKYLTLQRLGVSADDMRIMIVRDMNRGGEMHAVLELTNDDTRYLLDNQTQKIVAENHTTRYRPIYAINESNWWAYQ
ncbi:MAG: transglutaminase-like cysteine peptidase [Rickettsiales bacterium]